METITDTIILDNGIKVLHLCNGKPSHRYVLYRCGCLSKMTLTTAKGSKTGLCNKHINRESSTLRHGHARRATKQTSKYTPTYKTWLAMKRRCSDPRNGSYSRYGGMGIQVCDRWLECFDNFLEDMGEKPGPTYNIDRIDAKGNYELSNCRWVTIKENCLNKKQTHKIRYKNKIYSLKDLCRQLNLDYKSCWYYINKKNLDTKVVLGVECQVVYSPR